MSAWYQRHRRELPWRRSRDPYRIWISEILLQQTQVETVRPYFLRFVGAFPSVTALAAASLDEVLKVWEGCGYYARARHLHQAARQIVRDGGALPRTAEDLRRLPGIGAYTAAAIASIAFNEPVAVLDGNVERVLARVLRERRNIKLSAVQKRLRRAAGAAMSVAVDAGIAPGDHNQAMMEIGATVCLPRRADCARCPLRADCRAHSGLADVTTLPRKAPARQVPHYNVGAAILCRKDKILITQRPHDGLLGGLWEFPGGKCHDGETMPECIAREIREELGIEIRVGEPFLSVKHAYSHFRITLHAYLCAPKSGRIQKIGVADYCWVTRAELADYAFPKADRVILARLMEGTTK